MTVTYERLNEIKAEILEEVVEYLESGSTLIPNDVLADLINKAIKKRSEGEY